MLLKTLQPKSVRIRDVPMYNPDFNSTEFGGIRNQAGLNEMYTLRYTIYNGYTLKSKKDLPNDRT